MIKHIVWQGGEHMKENTKNARINVRAITFTAVMAALVFVFTYTFKIPFVNGYTHIGDSMIFLAVVFFQEPLKGQSHQLHILFVFQPHH